MPRLISRVIKRRHGVYVLVLRVAGVEGVGDNGTRDGCQDGGGCRNQVREAIHARAVLSVT